MTTATAPAFRSSFARVMAWIGLASCALTARAQTAINPVPEAIPWAVPDRQSSQVPDRVRLTGWVGSRVDASEANRLAKMDVDRLLEGYRKRPGRQSWDGEHVGKWLHAATLAWVYSGDPVLRQKLDSAVVELTKCQLDDGYLGTYLEKERWTEWDVWAHKYNLIGLLTYIRYTGNQASLATCRRMADLLCRTFGDEPGQRDILSAGHHLGMAPTSVLEPMVWMYRLTGEARYLAFCQYILRCWEKPQGPKIISTLLTAKRVDKVGNGKAYEMLSCLNGALEYYRTQGGPEILQACLNAWQDVVDKRLYLTGAASYGELFHDDFDLPNVANVGETCVTVTWLQFNAHLLRLTGEARFAEQLERVVLNQLFGAQRCDGAAWGYYVQMEGKKPYSSTLDGHCCLSSGPRGVALIPTFALTTEDDGIVVNLYDAGTAHLQLRDQTPVSVTIETRYPGDGRILVAVEPAARKNFTVRLRIPAWCRQTRLTVNGEDALTEPGRDGYVAITRVWGPSDQIRLSLNLEPRLVRGDHKNEGKAALLYGPLVLAADEALLVAPVSSLSSVALADYDLERLNLKPEPAPDQVKLWPGAQVFLIKAVARKTTGSIKAGTEIQLRLIPFADAGGKGTNYKVWLPVGLRQPGGSLLRDGLESRSRSGNQDGSINDDDFTSIVVTFDGHAAAEDWFAVELDEPVMVGRVIFAHGKTFHDGGWFDTSAGKPRLEVKVAKDSAWEKVGEFADYPAANATDSAKLKDGQRFVGLLSEPRKVVALRVIGKPACGDNSRQAFSSCAELQAFEGKN